MNKRAIAICAITSAGALSLVVAVLAQGGHGIPSPEKIYGNGVTWPIKIDIRDYDREKLTAPLTISEDAQTGRILWLQKCAYCHDGVGAPTYRTMGPWLGAEIIDQLGEGNVRSFISNGDVRMPAFKYNLDSHQIDDVLAFLKTVGSDQKPTAAQLASRTLSPTMSD